MSEFIVNPRRAPRANARCRTAVVSACQGAFEAETEDVGAHGCQVVSPRAIGRGEALRLQISNPDISAGLHLTGRVAWASTQPPWRLGIAFEKAAHPDAERWFHELLESMGGAGPMRRVPDRIPVDAVVYLGPPPRFLADFSDAEVKLLRAIGSGVSIAELKTRLRSEWPPAQRALFSLLARNHVTLSRGASVHPGAWRRVIDDIEGAIPVAPLGVSPAPIERAKPAPPSRAAATPVPVARAAPTPAPLGMRGPVPAAPPAALAPTSPPISRGEFRATARGLDAGGSWGTPARTPVPDFAGAGVGWRNPQRPRSSEAQQCLDLAIGELAAGRPSGALALLRRALALAPGDAEIAALIGKLAFR